MIWRVLTTYTSVETTYVEAATAEEARAIAEELSDPSTAESEDWSMDVESFAAEDVPYPYNVWRAGDWFDPRRSA